MTEQRHIPPSGETMIDHRTNNCPCGPVKTTITRRNAKGRGGHQGYVVIRHDFRHQPLASRPVVDRPDSVTHWTCPAAPFPGQTHHITAAGACETCKIRVSELREIQANILRRAS